VSFGYSCTSVNAGDSFFVVVDTSGDVLSVGSELDSDCAQTVLSSGNAILCWDVIVLVASFNVLSWSKFSMGIVVLIGSCIDESQTVLLVGLDDDEKQFIVANGGDRIRFVLQSTSVGGL
jgi:hypothetical protein